MPTARAYEMANVRLVISAPDLRRIKKSERDWIGKRLKHYINLHLQRIGFDQSGTAAVSGERRGYVESVNPFC